MTNIKMAPGTGVGQFPASSDHRKSFDFLLGGWNVRHRKLATRLEGAGDWFEFSGTVEVRSILAGSGNFDLNVLADPVRPYQAHCLRLFNPDLNRWSIWWFDSRQPSLLDPPVVGGFDGPNGTFYSHDRHDGRTILARTRYESEPEPEPALAQPQVRWTQAFSLDEGGSWEVNWIMRFSRCGS